jgi:hypothetical protein
MVTLNFGYEIDINGKTKHGDLWIVDQQNDPIGLNWSRFRLGAGLAIPEKIAFLTQLEDNNWYTH